MNVAMYLYDGYYETEIALAGLIFKRERLFTTACQDGPVAGGDGRRMHVDRRVEDLDPSEIDVLILPGGSPRPEPAALELIRACARRSAWIGGICAGVDLMAWAGILAGRRFTGYYESGKAYGHLPEEGVLTYRNLEVDGRLVTASYHAYLEFALALGLKTGVLREEDVPEYVDWFKKPFQRGEAW